MVTVIWLMAELKQQNWHNAIIYYCPLHYAYSDLKQVERWCWWIKMAKIQKETMNGGKKESEVTVQITEQDKSLHTI